MYFGQKYHRRGNERVPGRWNAYPTRQAAIRDGCEFVSVLELCGTVERYEAWSRENPNGRLKLPFRGPFYADFDARGNLVDLKKTLLTELWDLIDDFGLSPEDLWLWFSGAKGFHLLIPETLFSPTGFSHPHLPSIYRDFALALGFEDLMDKVVYSESRGRLWRVAGKRRVDGSRKIPLTIYQLANLTIKEIRDLSRGADPMRHDRGPMPKPNKGMCELFDGVVARFERQRRVRAKPAPRKPRVAVTVPEVARGPEEIEALLAALPDGVVDDYGDWLRVGMALHHASAGADWGLALWDDWSRGSVKYEAEVTAAKWIGFSDVEDGVTLATLIYWARNA